ncbi:hypothetical protein GEMRC1_009603 [Eukaryota sp. GEM-RC1]
METIKIFLSSETVILNCPTQIPFIHAISTLVNTTINSFEFNLCPITPTPFDFTGFLACFSPLSVQKFVLSTMGYEFDFEILQHFKNLKGLEVFSDTWTSESTQIFTTHISSITQLTNFRISLRKCGQLGTSMILSAIDNFKYLTYIGLHTIDHVMPQSVISSLSTRHNLKDLNLSSCFLTFDQVQIIFDFLKVAVELESLSLMMCLRDRAKPNNKFYMDGLANSKSLLTFDISWGFKRFVDDNRCSAGIPIEITQLTEAQFQGIENIIVRNCRIHTLVLSDNMFTNSQFSKLSQILKCNTSVRELSISLDNQLEFSLLGHALSCNRSIEVLDLGYCSFNETTVKPLVTACKGRSIKVKNSHRACSEMFVKLLSSS